MIDCRDCKFNKACTECDQEWDTYIKLIIHEHAIAKERACTDLEKVDLNGIIKGLRMAHQGRQICKKVEKNIFDTALEEQKGMCSLS